MSKKQTKCNSLWEKDHSWLQKCKNDQFSAYCKICKKSFSVSGGGICLVKQHDNTKTHSGRTEELCNQLTFPKGSGIQLDKSIQFYDEEKTTRAEILQALKCVDAEFLPTTSTLKRIVKETDPYKRTVELTVPYTSFDGFIANDFEHFLIKFQSMAPRIYLLYTEMVRLIKTLISKFVKSRLLVGEMNFTKVPKSITYLQRINVTDIMNFKPINQ